MIMGGKPKNTDEQVRAYFQEHGYEWVDGEYKNNKEKLHLRCPEGHDLMMDFTHFKSGRRCPTCANLYKRSANKRNSKEYIREFVESNKCRVIDGLDQYRSTVKSKLTIECNCGHTFVTTFGSLKATNCGGCPECMKRKIGDKNRVDGQIVYDAFVKRGLTPLFEPKDYISTYGSLPCICNNHKDKGIQYRTYADVKYNKYPCVYCYKDNFHGEQCGNWQGGASALNNRLRLIIDEWKFNSLKHYDFKCQLTGTNNDLAVHHLHSFNTVVKEALNELNIDVRPTVGDYSQEELDIIDDMVLKLHDKYGYGVPLERNIHELFHKEYGKLYNTPEQFEEFKQGWLKGEFDVTEDVGEIANG